MTALFGGSYRTQEIGLIWRKKVTITIVSLGRDTYVLRGSLLLCYLLPGPNPHLDSLPHSPTTMQSTASRTFCTIKNRNPSEAVNQNKPLLFLRNHSDFTQMFATAAKEALFWFLYSQWCLRHEVSFQVLDLEAQDQGFYSGWNFSQLCCIKETFVIG